MPRKIQKELAERWQGFIADWRGNTRRMIGDYLQITLGALIMAVGYNLFLISNGIVSGGITGLGIIANEVFNWPVGLVVFALNVPLFAAGLRWGGGFTTGLRSVYGVIMLSLALDLTAPYLPVITDNPLLYIMYGGLLDGLGVGLVLRAQGTTGGTDIIGRVVKTWTGIPISQIVFVTNVIIIGLAALIFGVEKALYGVMVAAVSAYAVDFVLGGSNRVRQAIIISSEWQQIRDGVLAELGRGVTIVPARGGYTDNDRPILICVVGRSELITLRRLVMAIDPTAFVIVTATTEVWGHGFTAINDEIT